jgi:hypothetical protein
MLEVESSDTIYNVKAKCQIRDYHCLGVFSSLFYHKFTTQKTLRYELSGEFGIEQAGEDRDMN